MKTFYFFIFLFFVTSNVNAFNSNFLFKTKNRTKSCSVVNGNNGIQYSNNFGKTYNDCFGFSCNSGYHVEYALCVSNTKSCIVPNGSGIQTWNGSYWNTCSVVSCNSGYSISNNSCILNNFNVVCVTSLADGIVNGQFFPHAVCAPANRYGQTVTVNVSGGLFPGQYVAPFAFKVQCPSVVTNLDQLSGLTEDGGIFGIQQTSVSIPSYAASGSFIMGYMLDDNYGCYQVP